ncbi:MAG: ABC transporter permease [Arachidicoccus sp.]|nr:ABC transporter permease [Arachidicoccus sp.]
MFKHYFKTAWRNLKANKFYTTLNISGLAVGLATGIMLLLWVENQFSYDKFNMKYKNIYQLNTVIHADKDQAWNMTPGGLAAFGKNIPDVNSSVRIKDRNDQIIARYDRKKMLDGNYVGFVENTFLKIFDYKLIRGDKNNFLPDVSSAALTETLAKKLFGSDDVLGKTFNYFGEIYKVTAVLQDFPKNSSLQYDALFPMQSFINWVAKNYTNGNTRFLDEDFEQIQYKTFFLLNKNANAISAANTLQKEFKKRNNDAPFSFHLQNIATLHLTDTDGNTSRLRMVNVMLAVAFLLLAIAGINYINLSTARSLTRIKEVSVRKIIGANKRQLFFQFITETVIIFIAALFFGCVIISLLSPLYNSITGTELSDSLFQYSFLSKATAALLITLIGTAVYPALLLSSFKPLESLKGNIKGIKANVFRKILVVLQFSVSFILLVSTVVMSKQMHYIRTKDTGYDKSYVMAFPLTNNILPNLKSFEEELQKNMSVINAGVSDAFTLTSVDNGLDNVEWQGKSVNDKTFFNNISADKHFIETIKFQFIDGHNFSGTQADSTSFILNETAVKQMHLRKPYSGQNIKYRGTQGTIIGVLKDFNYKSLTQSIGPMIINNFGIQNIMYVRTTAAHAKDAIAYSEKTYKKYSRNAPFSYSFLDKNFEEQYKTDAQINQLFNVFAGVAIFISCLGLFGLATYTAQVKTKEIGIRKVLGASVGSIVQLISKGFLKLIVIAIIIATPLAYWAMNKWLGNFAYKITIGAFTFVIAAFVVIVIAFGTIGFKALKAARANPVKSLKTE